MRDSRYESGMTRKSFRLQDEALCYKVKPMSLQSQAEENLRVIRSLMEKATIYRAISAPGALIGGLLSVGLSASALAPLRNGAVLPFRTAWMAILVSTSLANLWLLRRDAGRRGESFVSPGMKLALRAMLPALLAGGVCTLVSGEGGAALTATLWVLCYGTSLLTASHFAPKSISLLGRAFFTAGVGLMISATLVFHWWQGANQTAVAHGIMGTTFGLFHLVYAACVWPRRTPAAPCAP